MPFFSCTAHKGTCAFKAPCVHVSGGAVILQVRKQNGNFARGSLFLYSSVNRNNLYFCFLHSELRYQGSYCLWETSDLSIDMLWKPLLNRPRMNATPCSTWTQLIWLGPFVSRAQGQIGSTSDEPLSPEPGDEEEYWPEVAASSPDEGPENPTGVKSWEEGEENIIQHFGNTNYMDLQPELIFLMD